MRVLSLVSALALAGVAACGTMGQPNHNSYEAQEQQLRSDCRERGGFLTPTGSQSGRPQTDNVCKINGEPSNLARPRLGLK